jgi:hypothetical protein
MNPKVKAQDTEVSPPMTSKAPKGDPKTREEALEEIARVVDPTIRAWKKATADHDAAKIEKAEANYNKTLDEATIVYERWCKAHRQPP